MFKSITIINSAGRELFLDIRRPYDTGLVVEGVEGLSPVNSAINVTTMATRDGGEYNSSRMEFRNIVLNFGIVGNAYKSVEEVRSMLYEYLPIKRQVKIVINTEYKNVYAIGYVESNEIDMFTNSEKASISIVCPDPYLYDVNTQHSTTGEPLSTFKFPFSNESLTRPTLELGLKTGNNDTISVRYRGTISTGFTASIKFTYPVERPKITHLGNGMFIELIANSLTIDGVGGFAVGDEVVISTVVGNKHITLIRDGKSHNIIHTMSKDSKWFNLDHGVNVISRSSMFEDHNIHMNVVISNDVKYEGV